VLGVLGRVEVDVVHLEQREIALAFLGRTDLAGHGIAGAQVEATYLAGGDVDVVRAGQVGALGGAQEAEAVLQDLEDPVPGDLLAVACVRLEDGEDHVRLARTCHALEPHGVSQLDDLLGRLAFEFGQVHRIVGLCLLVLCLVGNRRDGCGRVQRLVSMKAASWDLDMAPTYCACTVPPLKIMRVGMLRMPYFWVTCWFSSTLTLAILSLPWKSAAISSRIG